MRHRRLLAALLPVFLVGGSLPPALATAQSGGGLDLVTLELAPVGDATVTGLAVLTRRDADTAANVLAIGAPAGAMAVIHAGTCDAIDPLPVGLLGDVGTTGQLAATVPIPFAVIADGTHVLAFHPGLDLATAIACGAIPRSAGAGASAGPGASGHPVPTTAPTAAPVPSPTADAACEGMDTWVADTLARYATLKSIATDLGVVANAGMDAYARALAQASVTVQQVIIDQQRAAVPDAAREVQADIIKAYQKLVEAYDLMAQAYATSDTGLLQQGLSAASEAQATATAASAAMRRVATPCGVTVPAA